MHGESEAQEIGRTHVTHARAHTGTHTGTEQRDETRRGGLGPGAFQGLRATKRADSGAFKRRVPIPQAERRAGSGRRVSCGLFGSPGVSPPAPHTLRH